MSEKPLILPREFEPDLVAVLGIPNFQAAPIAHAFRDSGRAEIRRRSEDEQAFVLHWLLTLYLENGKDWQTKAAAILAEVIAEAKEASATKSATGGTRG